MVQFLQCQDIARVQKTFLVHGEYETQLSYKKTLENTGFKQVEIPGPGEVFEL